MKLAEVLTPELVLIAPEVADRDQLFEAFARTFARAGLVTDGAEVVRRLVERETILSTGIGGGVAVPHAQLERLGRLVMAASVHPDGLPYPSLDEQPVRLVFCLLGDSTTAADHLAGLARLARLARRPGQLNRLVSAVSGDAFVSILAEIEADS